MKKQYDFTMTVLGSTGNTYYVKRRASDSGWECTCPRANFDRFGECRHVRQVKDRVQDIPTPKRDTRAIIERVIFTYPYFIKDEAGLVNRILRALEG